MKKIAPFVTILGSLLLTIVPLMGTAQVWATPDCSAGTTMDIVAHPDDDLVFINPKIQEDINANKCVTTIYMTSGDSGGGLTPAESREEGIRVAYASMAGASNSWSNTTLADTGHTLQVSTLSGNERVKLVFMRLPDGGTDTPQVGFASDNYETLQKLSNNVISSVDPIDGSASYTDQAVVDTLKDQMVSANPDTVRTLNFVDPYGAVSDHTDHLYAARYTERAHRASNLRHTFVGYRGYDTKDLSQNLSGTVLTQKESTYFAYDAYDNDGQCPSTTSCNIDHMIDWLQRNYAAGTDTYQYQTMDGDLGSSAGNNTNSGKLPATATFNGNIWAFYYDQTNGYLRYAKSADGTVKSWTFGTIDTSSNTGLYPTAVVYNNALHVFYYDATNSSLRHAWIGTTGGWQFNTLDGAAGALSSVTTGDMGVAPTATVYGTSLQLFYQDYGNQNLRHAWFDGTTWNFENLDGDTGSILHHNTDTGYDPTVTVYDGCLQLFYYDHTNGDLRHVWENAGWHDESLDGGSTSAGRLNTDLGYNPSVTIYDTTLQLVYYDQTHGDLRHAWVDASGWHFENLDGNGSTIIGSSSNIGATPSIAVDGSTLQITAYDSTHHSLRHYWSRPTQGWQGETLDGTGSDGSNPGVVSNDTGSDPAMISFNGRLHVFYYQVGDTNFRHILW